MTREQECEEEIRGISWRRIINFRTHDVHMANVLVIQSSTGLKPESKITSDRSGLLWIAPRSSFEHPQMSRVWKELAFGMESWDWAPVWAGFCIVLTSARVCSTLSTLVPGERALTRFEVRIRLALSTIRLSTSPRNENWTSLSHD